MTAMAGGYLYTRYVTGCDWYVQCLGFFSSLSVDPGCSVCLLKAKESDNNVVF